jgi:hypothetical protein
MDKPDITLASVPVVELKQYCGGCLEIDLELTGSLLYMSQHALEARAIRCRHAAACERMHRRFVTVVREGME